MKSSSLDLRCPDKRYVQSPSCHSKVWELSVDAEVSALDLTVASLLSQIASDGATVTVQLGQTRVMAAMEATLKAPPPEV